MEWIVEAETLSDFIDHGRYTITTKPLIRCKDCKHWREGTVYTYCDKLYGMGVLDTYDYMTEEDDYCSKAERRTDER